jgi:hypothetical protein
MFTNNVYKHPETVRKYGNSYLFIHNRQEETYIRINLYYVIKIISYNYALSGGVRQSIFSSPHVMICTNSAILRIIKFNMIITYYAIQWSSIVQNIDVFDSCIPTD